MKPHVITKDFTLSVPDDWIDKSMQIWTAPPKKGQAVAPNVVVTREPLPKGQKLDRFINQQMQELLKADPELDLTTRNTIEWHERPAVEMVLSWDNNGTRLKQRQLYIQQNTDEIISLVFTSAESDFEKFLSMFRQMEATFTWTPKT